MKHHKYINTETKDYKEFTEYIKSKHPDPDHLIESMERWFWLFMEMKKTGQVAAAHAYIEGFNNAKESLNAAFESVRQKVKKRFGL